MVKEMVRSLVQAGSKVERWVLVSIKDPEVNVVSITNDHAELETSLDELQYGGGEDLEEQVLKGERNFFKTFLKKLYFTRPTVGLQQNSHPIRTSTDVLRHIPCA